MSNGSRSWFGRCLAIAAMAMALYGAAPIQPASAQGLLDALFGNYQPRHSLPPRVSAYSDPFGFGDERMQRRPAANYSGAGPSSGFCVRTCDGRYFPVKSSGGMSATELCNTFCPAAKTKVFGGSRIEHAVASDGTRYAGLDTAFLFRERKVDNCTCSSGGSLGLTPLKPELDPTLRPGDVVATNEGLVTYSGNRRAKTAEFTPIEKSGGSAEWKLRLMSLKVAPAPERAEEPAKTAEEDGKPARTELRRAQR